MKSQDDFQPNSFKENQNLKLILRKLVDNVSTAYIKVYKFFYKWSGLFILAAFFDH